MTPHFLLSLMKSMMRIVGLAFLVCFPIWAGATVLIFAEIIGIAEELV